MSDRAIQAFGAILMVYMAWVLSSLMGSLQYERTVIVDLVDRVSALEERSK